MHYYTQVILIHLAQGLISILANRDINDRPCADAGVARLSLWVQMLLRHSTPDKDPESISKDFLSGDLPPRFGPFDRMVSPTESFLNAT